MATPPDLRDELAALERLRDAGDKRGTVARAGVVLERLLKWRARDTIEGGRGDRPKLVLDRLEGDLSRLATMSLKPLMKVLEGDKELDRRRRDLWALVAARNWAAHDSDAAEPGGLEVTGFVDLVWELVEAFGLKEAGWRATIRQELAQSRAASRRGGVPGMLLDRQPQKRAVEDRLPAAAPAMVVVLHGGAEQGHGHLATYALNQARSKRSGPWSGVPPIAWPAAELPEAMRWGVLVERTGRAVLGEEVSDAPALVARLGAFLAREERLFLRLTVPDPDPAGAPLFGRYMHEVWRPVLAELPDLYLLATIEAVVPEPAGWFFSKSRRAAERARKGVSAITAAVDGDGGVFDLVTPPELSSLSVDDIQHGLPDALRQRMTPAEARAFAQAAWDKSDAGRFERVLAYLNSVTG